MHIGVCVLPSNSCCEWDRGFSSGEKKTESAGMDNEIESFCLLYTCWRISDPTTNFLALPVRLNYSPFFIIPKKRSAQEGDQFRKWGAPSWCCVEMCLTAGVSPLLLIPLLLACEPWWVCKSSWISECAAHSENQLHLSPRSVSLCSANSHRWAAGPSICHISVKYSLFLPLLSK